jgi:hypothetical protein
MITKIDDITIRKPRGLHDIQNVTERLNKYNHIESIPLYPPPDNIEKFHTETYGDYILLSAGLMSKANIAPD